MHGKYGNLSEYGCGEYLLENVFRDISLVIKDIKSSLAKAERDFNKVASEKELIKRGC